MPSATAARQCDRPTAVWCTLKASSAATLNGTREVPAPFTPSWPLSLLPHVSRSPSAAPQNRTYQYDK